MTMVRCVEVALIEGKGLVARERAPSWYGRRDW